MTKKQIWVAIVGSGVIASITTAASFFPEQRGVLIASATFVTALVSYISGQNNG